MGHLPGSCGHGLQTLRQTFGCYLLPQSGVPLPLFNTLCHNEHRPFSPLPQVPLRLGRDAVRTASLTAIDAARGLLTITVPAG